MDVETTEAIERLSERLDLLEASLRDEFRGGMANLRDELREEIHEVRRHAVVLNESTRDDIRLVAEAVAHLSVKIDSLKQ